MQEAEKVAYMFTGQGSQYPGMWEGLKGSPVARRIFEMTEEIVGFSLSTADLSETSKAQPAIVAHSLAALAAAKELYPEIFAVPSDFCLGHSVGEYSALIAAGAINLERGISLVNQRGLFMEEAGPGKMAALFFKDKDQDQISFICRESGAEVANFNCPGQIVISGRVEAIEDAVRLAEERKIRTKLLDIAVASHSSLMMPAQLRFAEVLGAVDLKMPEKISVISNVTAEPYRSAYEIQELLAKQLTSSVYWERSVRYALEKGVTTFIEFGPQQDQPVLIGLLKRINREARGFCISNLASIQNLHNPY